MVSNLRNIMYKLTNNKNLVINTESNENITKGSDEWKLYIKWVLDGNRPLPRDRKVIKQNGISISPEQWDDLDECKTIASIKTWLKDTFK